MTTPPPLPAPVCKNCEIHPPEEGYEAPICKECREKFVAHPVPVWLKTAALLIALVASYSMLRFPAVWQMATVYKQGKTAEKNAAYADAATRYEQVVAAYPEADDAWIRLAAVSHRAGNDRRVVEALSQLRGKKLQKSQVRQVNNLIEEVEKDHGQDEPEQEEAEAQ